MKCLSEEHLTVHLETGLNRKVYRCLIVGGENQSSQLQDLIALSVKKISF